MIALIDVQPHLTDLVSLRLLKEIAQNYHNNPRTALLIDNRISLPQDLARLGVRYSPKLPDTDRIHDIDLEEAYQWLHDKPGGKIIREGEGESEAKFLETLHGTTEEDARLLTKRAIQDGRIAASDINQVIEFKRNALATSGLAEFVVRTKNFESVGGLKHLKTWLQLRRDAFINDMKSVGLAAPKAVLLLGVQDVGKSLAAKAIAGNWGVPLTRLEVRRIAELSEGFSGSKIEQVIVAALFSAHAVNRPISTQQILDELTIAKPLSVIMRKKVSALRSWASGRTVAAN